MRQGLITLIGLLVTSAVAFAQDELTVKAQLGPNTYPAAARAVRAQGEVRLEVKVNQKGRPVHATVQSGHPLLQAVSKATALRWVFSESSDVETRTVNLFFNYAIGGFRRIESATEPEVSGVSIRFPSEFSVQVLAETLIPRSLLLPRRNGEIVPMSCPRHNLQMNVEVQERCGTSSAGFMDPIFATVAYLEANSELFPHASSLDYLANCGELSVESQEVYFCLECRSQRQSWLARNK